MSRAVDMRPGDAALVAEILARDLPPGGAVWAFGSRVRGPARRGADLDLAVDLGRPRTLQETCALSAAFEDSLLPWRVDVVDLHAISPAFRQAIAADLTPLAFQAGRGRG